MMIKGAEKCDSKILVRPSARQCRRLAPRPGARIRHRHVEQRKRSRITASLGGPGLRRVQLQPPPLSACVPGLFSKAARDPMPRARPNILSDMHNANDSITVAGLYYSVHDLQPDVKADLEGLRLTPENSSARSA